MRRLKTLSLQYNYCYYSWRIRQRIGGSDGGLTIPYYCSFGSLLLLKSFTGKHFEKKLPSTNFLTKTYLFISSFRAHKNGQKQIRSKDMANNVSLSASKRSLTQSLGNYRMYYKHLTTPSHPTFKSTSMLS